MSTLSRTRGRHSRMPRQLIFSILVFLMSFAGFLMSVAHAASDVVTVFDMRKSLPLDAGEPTYYDFYINAGPEAGLKKGMYVTVVRKSPVHDPVQNKAQATLSVDVARVQIIHVERHISVARVVSEFGPESRPLLEFEAIMIGDILDLSTVSMEPPKNPRRLRASDAQASKDFSSEKPPAASSPAVAPAPAPSRPTHVEIPSPQARPPGMLRPANEEQRVI